MLAYQTEISTALPNDSTIYGGTPCLCKAVGWQQVVGSFSLPGNQIQTKHLRGKFIPLSYPAIITFFVKKTAFLFIPLRRHIIVSLKAAEFTPGIPIIYNFNIRGSIIRISFTNTFLEFDRGPICSLQIRSLKHIKCISCFEPEGNIHYNLCFICSFMSSTTISLFCVSIVKAVAFSLNPQLLIKPVSGLCPSPKLLGQGLEMTASPSEWKYFVVLSE